MVNEKVFSHLLKAS